MQEGPQFELLPAVTTLLVSLGALVGVLLLAVVALRLIASRGSFSRAQHLELVERLSIDQKNTVALIKVPGSLLVVGSSDGAAPTLLKELPEGSIDLTSKPDTRMSFRSLLRGAAISRKP